MYQDEFSRYLTDNTRCSWHQVPRLYVDFKLSTSPTGHICVATPDAYPRQEPFCRFYMPKNNEHIYHPRHFVDHLLNAKKHLTKAMPWIKLDIDNFPKMKGFQTLALGAHGMAVIDYEISLTGDVKMKKIGGLNNQTLGIGSFHNIAYNAKQEFFGVISNMKANFNMRTKQVSVGESVVGPLGSTSFKINSDNSIEAEYTPNDFVKHYDLFGWHFQTHLGYKIKAKYEVNNSQQQAHHTSWVSTAGHVLTYGAVGLLGAALIVVTAGAATGPEALAFAAFSV